MISKTKILSIVLFLLVTIGITHLFLDNDPALVLIFCFLAVFLFFDWDSKIGLITGVSLLIANYIFYVVNRHDLINSNFKYYALVFVSYWLVTTVYYGISDDGKISKKQMKEFSRSLTDWSFKRVFKICKKRVNQGLKYISKIETTSWIKAFVLVVAVFLSLAIFRFHIVNVFSVILIIVSLFYPITKKLLIFSAIFLLILVTLLALLGGSEWSEYLATLAYYLLLIVVFREFYAARRSVDKR